MTATDARNARNARVKFVRGFRLSVTCAGCHPELVEGCATMLPKVGYGYARPARSSAASPRFDARDRARLSPYRWPNRAHRRRVDSGYGVFPGRIRAMAR